MKSTLSLHAQYRTISLETQAGEASLQKALTRLPSFLKAVTDSLVKSVTNPYDVLFRAKDLSWAAERLAEMPYAQLRAEAFPAITDAKVDHLTYLKVLHENILLANEIEAKYIAPLVTFLSKKLGNPDSLRTASPDPLLEHIKLEPIKAATRAISHVLGDKAEATRPYGQLIKRNADWQEILPLAKAVHDGFGKADHENFTGQFERCNELLGTLIGRLTASENHYAVSAVTLGRITDAAYIVATAVEFYGMTYRRATALDTVWDRTIEATKKINL